MRGYIEIEERVGFGVGQAQQTHYFNNTATTASGIYTYDALYRLKTATGRELTSLQLPSNTDFVNNIAVPNTSANAMQNYTQEFDYDELGNINQMKSVGNWTRDYFYNNNNNYLLGHTNGNTEYNYDKHGNITAMPHLTSMLWDYKDELKEVTLNASGDKAYYVYDTSGERVRKVVEKTGGIIEERIYLGGCEIYRKTVSGVLDFERETLHISDNTKKIASIETKTVENGSTISSPVSNIRYQYDNHLGSASLELDENAAIISYEEYHPFGTTSYRSGRTETEVSLKRYKYVGKERDEETGLYYYGARYYAAWIARFVSVDPMAGKFPSYAPFVYSNNNPLRYSDPTGMQSEDEVDQVHIPKNPKQGDAFSDLNKQQFTFEDGIGWVGPEAEVFGDFRMAGANELAEIKSKNEGITYKDAVLETEKWAGVIEEIDLSFFKRNGIKRSNAVSSAISIGANIQDLSNGGELTPMGALSPIPGIGTAIGLLEEYVANPHFDELEAELKDAQWEVANSSWEKMGSYTDEYNNEINSRTVLFIYAGKDANIDEDGKISNVFPTTEFVSPEQAEEILGFTPANVFVSRLMDNNLKINSSGNVSFHPSNKIKFK